MTFFRESKVNVGAPAESTTPDGRMEKRFDSDRRSGSTFILDDQWDTSDRASEYSPSSPPCSGHGQDLMECESPDGAKTMTEVFRGNPPGGSRITMPSTPPLRVVSVGSSSSDSQEDIDTEFGVLQGTDLPSQLHLSKWSEASSLEYPVRSADYLKSRRKVPGESVMKLFAVDLVQTDTPLSMCEHPDERLQQSLRLGNAPGFCFAVNICLPAPKGCPKVKGDFYQFVAYFGVEDRARLFDKDTPVGRLAKSFCSRDMDDSFRDQTFKLIPRIVHGGGFLFRQAVGTKPVLLGRKVSQRYFFLRIIARSWWTLPATLSPNA